jgi:long-subunit acyl-CoA synthetase (AMP-forming)
MATEITAKKHKPINRARMNHVAPRASDILDLLEQVRDHGDRIAYRYYVGREIKDMTYSQLYTSVCQCAAAFDTMGLKGSRVAVIGDTSPQWIITYMAALATGCVAVPMDKELDVVEICKFLDIVEAKAIVYSKSFNEKFVDAIQNSKTGVPPFAVGKYQDQAKRFSQKELRGILEESADIDESVKTGKLTDILGVELFIMKYSGK